MVLDLIRKALDDCFEFSIIVYYFTASLILNLLQKDFSEQVCEFVSLLKAHKIHVRVIWRKQSLF